MATEHDAAAKKMEEEFRRHQSRLLARLSGTAFQRTTWTLAFVGALLICITLFNTPNAHGGLPLPLIHEYLISFAVASGVGIFLNLSAFFIHLLACINEMNLNKTVETQPPSLKVIKNCIYQQTKLILALEVTELLISLLGSLFRAYVFLVAVSSAFVSYVDAKTNTRTFYRHIEFSCYLLYAFKMLFDRFLRQPALD